jgi:hypothetical protein
MPRTSHRAKLIRDLETLLTAEAMLQVTLSPIIRMIMEEEEEASTTQTTFVFPTGFHYILAQILYTSVLSRRYSIERLPLPHKDTRHMQQMLQQADDGSFRNYLRMKRESFAALAQELGADPVFTDSQIPIASVRLGPDRSDILTKKPEPTRAFLSKT